MIFATLRKGTGRHAVRPGGLALRCAMLAILLLQAACSPVGAETLRERIEARRAAAAARDGADEEARAAPMTRSVLTVNGRERGFYVHVPANAGAAPGVVLVFHGGQGSAETMSRQNPMVAAADAGGFLAVFPDSYEGNWTDGRISTMGGPDDLAFVRALVADLVRRHGADPGRVFAAGISNGAMFTYKLACDAPGLVRAIAPVAGNMPEALAVSCRPSRGTPVIMFSGTADPFMPYAGGKPRDTALMRRIRGEATDTMLSAQDTIAFWARLNGCGSVQTAALPDSSDDGTTVTRIAYDCGAATLYRIDGGGHTWPGSSARIAPRLTGPTSMDIDATSLMVQFFRAQGL